MAGGSSSAKGKGKRKRNGGDISGNQNRKTNRSDNVDDGEISSIYVETFTKKTISLEVKPSDTIRDVKFKIWAKEGIPAVQQALIFNEMVLDDTNTITDFEIHNNSTLKLIRKSRGLMQIFIKIPRWGTISPEAKPSDTIGSFKSRFGIRKVFPLKSRHSSSTKCTLRTAIPLLTSTSKRTPPSTLCLNINEIFVMTLTTGIGTGKVISLWSNL